MAREIKLKISLDGGKEVEAKIDDIGDGLRDLDVRNARDAAEAIESIGRGNNLKRTAEDAQTLKEVLDNVDDDQLRAATESIKEVGTEAQQSAAVYRDASGRLRDENGKFVKSANDAGQAAKKLGGDVENAAKQFDKLKNAGATVKNFGGDVQNFGQQLTVGVTLPIIGLGIAAIKSFADVELAVAGISTIKPEIDTKVLFTQLNEMSTRVPQTAQQLGDGLYQIFSSINVTQAEGLKLLESFAKGATAAQTDASTFGQAVLGVLNAYKLSTEEANHISDVFFNTINLGVVNGAELASSLGTVTQAAKNTGVSFDELGALIVGVTREGGEASQNINNLANFLMKLPTKETSAAFKQFGVDVQIAGKFRPVIDVLGDLKLKLDAMSDSDAAQALQKIAPDAQARTGLQTLLSQLDAVKEALEVNKTASGAAEQAYGKIAATANVQFSLLKNTAIAVLAELGSAILPLLQPLIIWLGQNLVPAVKEAVATFKSWSPQMQIVALAVVGFVAAIAPVLTILGTITVAIGAVISAIGTIAGAVASIGLAPLLIVIAAVAVQVAALGAAAYVLYEAWQANFGNIQGVVSVFVSDVSAAFNDLLTVIQPAVDSVTSYVTEGFNQISQWWAENGEIINQAATKVFATLLESVKLGLDIIRDLWATYGGTIKETVANVWGNIKTIISNVIGIIGDVIKLGAQIINNDWDGAWETFKGIVAKAFDAIVASMKATGNLLAGAVKLAFQAVWDLQGYLVGQAGDLGENVGKGLYNGLHKWVNPIGALGTYLGEQTTKAIGIGADTHSPSRATFAIGEFVGEGLALGIEAKTPRVKSAAKKLADETIKELREAIKAFEKLAGASPEKVARIQQTNQIQDATSKQSEIIKLRDQLKVDNYKPLPTTVAGTDADLRRLQGLVKAQEELEKSNENLTKLSQDVRDDREKETEAFAKKIKAMQDSGALELLNLQKEFDLLGVTDERERRRIENQYEILRLREQMKADGYGESQIAEAEAIAKSVNAANAEWQRMAEIKRQGVEAGKLGKDLDADLETLRRNGRELTEYEKVLKKIETSWKDLTAAEKEELLAKASQIDAQKQFNEQYNQTYDLIKNSLGVLFDSGKSFGEKMRTIFSSIFDSFKEMILKMTAQWLTSKLFNSGNSQGSSGGGIFGTIKNIFSGFFGNQGSGSSNGSFGGLFSGNSGGGIFSFLGGNNPVAGINGGTPSAPPASGSGIGLAGGLSIGGMAASVLGGLIGGRAGGIISGIGQGVSIGAMFGPWGALAGGAIGGILSLFGGDPKRKRDKNEKLPALNQAFADALAQLRALGADKNAFYANPEETIAKAVELRGQIASGFGIQFESKKYSGQAQQLIAAKLVEADGIIAELNKLKNRALRARDVDSQLKTSFADGGIVSQFARLNNLNLSYQDLGAMRGRIPGVYDRLDDKIIRVTGNEVVLTPEHWMPITPYLHKAKVPGFANGGLVSNVSAPSFPSQREEKQQPLIVQIYLNNSGIVESDIEDVMVQGFKKDAVQIELVKGYDKGKTRNG